MISLNDMTSSSFPLTLSELQTLAPSHLPCLRDGRYQGEEERVTLDVFEPEDRLLLGQFYDCLLQLFHALRPVQNNASAYRQTLETFVATTEYRNLTGQVARLGQATLLHKSKVEVNRIVHDLRGGAFQALAFRLQLFAAAPDAAQGIQNIFFLVRDHLKIMRNCVRDLDPEHYDDDEISRAHDAQLLVEKWSNADFDSPGKKVKVELNCRYGGTLCESCLEFSSLDRIVYNLMNNAGRYTSDGHVYFYVLPVPGSEEGNVRFVVANAITEEHRERLKNQFGNDVGEAFRGGFTTGGHGLGMRICADFCAHAYGIFDFAVAKKTGYFGARLLDDYFSVWFHWPTIGR